jgi:hypothetical protein
MTVTVLDRAPVTGDAGRVAGEQRRPDPEVPARARQRTFTAQYKLDVLAAYDAAEPGEKGAILRREGLYSSHIVDWRRARRCGHGRWQEPVIAHGPDHDRGSGRQPGTGIGRADTSRPPARTSCGWRTSPTSR